MGSDTQCIILITGASSGFGSLSSRALAEAGYTVYAGVRKHEQSAIQEIKAYTKDKDIDIRCVLLDITSDESVLEAVGQIITEAGRIDVLIHNAGHMSYGVSEAFSPKQLMELYDVNVIGAHRLNRAALPHMRNPRKETSGGKATAVNCNGKLIIWVGSSSSRGGTPPFFGPYFAAKAAMDALAISYAGELSLWGIETSIIIPGAYTAGTNHFSHSMTPEDKQIEMEYTADSGPYYGITDTLLENVVRLKPKDADPQDVARAIVEVVGMEYGKRPLRKHVNTELDGAHVANAVGDRLRQEAMMGYGLTKLLKPRGIM